MKQKKNLKALLLLLIVVAIGASVPIIQSSVTAAEESEAAVLQTERVNVYVIIIDNISDAVVERLKKTSAVKYYAYEGSKMKVYTDRDFALTALTDLFRGAGEHIEVIDQFTDDIDLSKYTKD